MGGEGQSRADKTGDREKRGREMIITIKTTIGFVLPKEFRQAVKFKEEHEGWTEHLSTQLWAFTVEETFSKTAADESEVEE